MPTKIDLLTKYAQQVRRRDLAWDRDYSQVGPQSGEFVEALLQLVDYDYPRDRLNKITADPVLQMQALLQDVLEDVRGFLPSNCQHFADQSIIGLLPRSQVNASCFGSRAGITDGYLIGLNSGLIHGTGLAAAALIAEAMPSSHYPSGTELFAASTRFFGLGTAKDFEESLRLTTHFPAEVQVQVGANHAVMLWFVALHECGHIAHGDVDEGRASTHVTSASESSYVPPTWEEEFAADKFAIECFLGQKPDAERAWTNYATVDLLYRWLDLAACQRKPSDEYPPTQQRIARLRSWMSENWSDDPNDHLQTLDVFFNRWSEEGVK